MAIVLSKLFMRTISQNPNENQTGISLWTLQDVEKAQQRQKELEMTDQAMRGPEEEEYGDGGIDDRMLGEIDLDV
jgi:DNA excision repair protein ERCC-2